MMSRHLSLLIKHRIKQRSLCKNKKQNRIDVKESLNNLQSIGLTDSQHIQTEEKPASNQHMESHANAHQDQKAYFLKQHGMN